MSDDWSWTFEKSDGSLVELGEAAQAFATQADAESWVGEHYPALVGQGVDAVRLLNGGKLVYGPMSLHPQDVP